MSEDLGFELLFGGIRELHSSVGEEFYSVVLERIVGGGNNHARLKILLPD